MFSFIKALERFFAYLKSRKGLWFTTLSVVSILGIAIAMYLFSSITQSSIHKVYENLSKNYLTRLDGEISDKQKDLKKLSIAIRLNTRFTSNLANQVELNTFISEYNTYLEANGFPYTKIYYYPISNQVNQYRTSINSTITRKEASFGYEIIGDGPSLVYFEPIRSGDNNVVGILELRENIFSLKADMERNGSLFLFLVEDKMLPNISIDHREGRYRVVMEDLKVEEARYDGKFFANIIENGKEEFEELKKDGFLLNDKFFKATKQVTDINGVIAGQIVMGEKADGEGAFVDIVKKMTKSVAMIALGLIMAMVIFLY